MRNQFKNTILKLASRDERLILIFGDISVFLFKEFWEKYPKRFFNAGICENTEISMAAGLSAEGFFPFVHTIAPFVTERSYEQVKLDLCYNGAGGNIVSCGGSFDYAWDGATHHCYTDLELMRMLPRMEVMQPGSNHELDVLISSRYNSGNPTYTRIASDSHEMNLPAEFGKAVKVQEKVGAKMTVVTAGPLLKNVFSACNDLPVDILYFHTIKPLDTRALAEVSTREFLVVHDAFGLFEAVAGLGLARTQYYGIPDKFCCFYGELDDIRRHLGLDSAGIKAHVQKVLERLK